MGPAGREALADDGERQVFLERYESLLAALPPARHPAVRSRSTTRGEEDATAAAATSGAGAEGGDSSAEGSRSGGMGDGGMRSGTAEAELRRLFGAGEEHVAEITGPKLGMTVENVLERTVVHDVEPKGPAVAAGISRGELLVGIGSDDAANFTHDEAIERLRQTHRPLLRLVLLLIFVIVVTVVLYYSY